MSRVELAKGAQWAADLVAVAMRASGLEPIRVVVILTDTRGDFVGVGSNTSRADTLAIVRCAGEPVDHVDH